MGVIKIVNKTVLLLGCDGYLGFPLALRLIRKGYKVIGIDNFSRRKYVKEVNSISATPIDHWDRRNRYMFNNGDFVFLNHSIHGEYQRMLTFLSQFKIDAIINLAQQPSAPFSHKSRQHAIDTTYNNIIGTLNILYMMKEICFDAQLIQIGSMGEYKHDAGVTIPEGKFDMVYKGKVWRDAIFPRQPGSIYHLSKTASTYYIDAACRWWGLRATDIMQGVVYGGWTPEIEESGLYTRMDTDECFGTVANKFILQNFFDLPLTVFGDGEHSRGFLSINDSIQCLMLALENDIAEGEYRTWNQLDETYTMNEIAEIVTKVGKRFGHAEIIEHIPTPRKENTKYFEYNVITGKLQNLGFAPTRTIEDEVIYLFNILETVKDKIYQLKNNFIPKITWQ